ncbi:hypothetical protein MPRM_53830 [Mycobacterium parmense]|uniref:Uncharacterized protein n=1 Tax=Mycobacterium parmense TaxID=185642 RepID=A0A7I7Z358_9MYCO|nr:hypothetical protein MPRM_53830 [Mycobacterium parmense]
MRRIPKSTEAQRLLASLDAEFADSSNRAGRDLVWSAAEEQVLSMIGEAIDRKVELSAEYADAQGAAKVRLATEIRLTEQAVTRLFRSISTEVAAPLSATSLKAQRAAHSRWNRERMKQARR